MKLSRRLIPAIAMLMVSAVLMSTASFAWFTMNNNVTATGMTVNATAASSLVIKGTTGSSDADFTNVGTNTAENTTLMPCTSKDGKTFGILNNVSVLNANSSAATWGENNTFDANELTTVPSASLASYVVTSTYLIKNIGEAADVYVQSITLNGTNAMNPAIRVAISLDGGTTMYVFNPNGGSLNDGKVGSFANSAWTLADPAYTTVNTTNAKIGELVADQEKTVTVLIWFEGQDTACKSDNVSTNDITIDIKFTNIAPTSGT